MARRRRARSHGPAAERDPHRRDGDLAGHPLLDRLPRPALAAVCRPRILRLGPRRSEDGCNVPSAAARRLPGHAVAGACRAHAVCPPLRPRRRRSCSGSSSGPVSSSARSASGRSASSASPCSWRPIARPAERRAAVRALVVVGVVGALVALPWYVYLQTRYSNPIFGRTSAPSSAVVKPSLVPGVSAAPAPFRLLAAATLPSRRLWFYVDPGLPAVITAPHRGMLGARILADPVYRHVGRLLRRLESGAPSRSR